MAGRGVGEEQFGLARSLLRKRVLYGSDHGRLVQHDDAARIEIVQKRAALVESEPEPRIRNVAAGVEMRDQRGACAGLSGKFARYPFANRRVARNLRPRHDVELGQLFHATLRLECEATDAFDRVSEELDARRPLRAGREQIQDAAAHRVLAGGADHVGAPVSQAVKPRQRLFPSGFVTRSQSKTQLAQDGGRHRVLSDGGNRREDDARLSVGDLREQRHARAALGRAFQRADGFVPRAKQRDRARLGFAEVVEQVSENALGDVGRRYGHENLAAQRAMDRRDERRPCGGNRFVERIRCARARCADAIEQRRQGAFGRFQTFEEKVA